MYVPCNLTECVYSDPASSVSALFGAMYMQVVVSTGVGNHQMMSCQFFRWTQPRSIITSGSLGTMGFGLPAAIGAAVGCPSKTVVPAYLPLPPPPAPKLDFWISRF